MERTEEISKLGLALFYSVANFAWSLIFWIFYFAGTAGRGLGAVFYTFYFGIPVVVGSFIYHSLFSLALARAHTEERRWAIVLFRFAMPMAITAILLSVYVQRMKPGIFF